MDSERVRLDYPPNKVGSPDLRNTSGLSPTTGGGLGGD
jgi:hypothetical protein